MAAKEKGRDEEALGCCGGCPLSHPRGALGRKRERERKLLL
jgi:hypothetical protein